MQGDVGESYADVLLDNGKRMFAGGSQIHLTDIATATETKSEPEQKRTPAEVPEQEMIDAIMEALTNDSAKSEPKPKKKIGESIKEKKAQARKEADDLWAQVKAELEGKAMLGVDPKVGVLIAGPLSQR